MSTHRLICPFCRRLIVAEDGDETHLNRIDHIAPICDEFVSYVQKHGAKLAGQTIRDADTDKLIGYIPEKIEA